MGLMGGLHQMDVLIINEVPGGDAAQDARMQQELGLQDIVPPGAIARFAGRTDSGGRVVSVWESEEAYRAFEREKLIPARERAGRTGRANVQVSPLESVFIAPTAVTRTTP